ncbi:MAG: GNAT family N-acetyltransferase [Saprospiraceae bacterium]|nr:GNAT family N-acetyltransferase [Saprospiraceae bacterium]
MERTFREGNIEDIEQLREIAIISYRQFEKVLTQENWNILYEKLKSESVYTEILKIAKCFVCEIEKEIIGVAYFVPSGNPTDIFAPNWSYLRMVGVNPKYRGHGISAKLTQLCIEYATNNGEKIIALHTSEFMNAARYIYEKLGFIKIKELNPLFGKKYWLYQLELS